MLRYTTLNPSHEILVLVTLRKDQSSFFKRRCKNAIIKETSDCGLQFQTWGVSIKSEHSDTSLY